MEIIDKLWKQKVALLPSIIIWGIVTLALLHFNLRTVEKTIYVTDTLRIIDTVKILDTVTLTKYVYKTEKSVNESVDRPTNEPSDKIQVKATYYQPVKAQTDGDPFTTADGGKISIKKLKAGSQRWVALSRDLLKTYPHGTRIKVTSDNPKLNGYWYVRDTMGPKHRKRIDFLTYPGDNLGMKAPINLYIELA